MNHRIGPTVPHRAPRTIGGVLYSVCRLCDVEIRNPDGRPNLRRTWHAECVEPYLITRSQGVFREAVFRRDGGVCASCGVAPSCSIDRHRRHDAAAKALRALTQLFTASRGFYVADRVARDVMREEGLYADLGLTAHDYVWEADHVIPLIDGGEPTLANAQTLCRPCHKAKSAREAAARARARKTAHMELLPGLAS